MIKWIKSFCLCVKKCFSGFEQARARLLCNIIDQLHIFLCADHLIAADSYAQFRHRYCLYVGRAWLQLFLRLVFSCFSGGQVAKLFQDSSLGNAVNIVVTRLILLMEDQVNTPQQHVAPPYVLSFSACSPVPTHHSFLLRIYELLVGVTDSLCVTCLLACCTDEPEAGLGCKKLHNAEEEGDGVLEGGENWMYNVRPGSKNASA